MSLWIKLAWRNILRNKRRTLLTSFSIGFGLAALILIDAFMIGMLDSMIKNATNTITGHAQIHHRQFRETFDINDTINKPYEVLSTLKKSQEILAFSPRIIFSSMLSSTANVAPASVYGIDVENERSVSSIFKSMSKGNFLSQADGKSIVLGAKLAELLEVDLGDPVILTAAQAKTNDMVQMMLRVEGIFKLGSRELDRQFAFIPISIAQKNLNLENQMHEISMRFKDLNLALNFEHPIWKRLPSQTNEFKSWYHLLPSLGAIVDWSEYTSLITGLILFALVSIGVINSMFMSLYERMYEFGVLKAIGTKSQQIFSLIILETIVLGMIAWIIGILIGGGLVYYFAKFGVDTYRGMEYSGVTFSEPIYPVARLSQFTITPLFVMLMTIIAAIYPALYAARVTPVEVLKKD